MKNNRFLYKLKVIFKAASITFLVYVIFAIIIAALIENSENKGFWVYFIFFAMYLLFLYITKISHNLDTYEKHGDRFNLSNEAISYFKTEGKYQLIIFTILAILCELSFLILHLVNPDSPRNFMVFICSPIFPLMNGINIPVLRSIISVFLISFSTTLLETFKSYLIYVNKNK